MEIDNHLLISDLSIEYADSMCDGDDSRKFCRGSIAAAYIIGAEEALRRVRTYIRESANVDKGLSKEQARTLLRIIDFFEGMPKNHGCAD